MLLFLLLLLIPKLQPFLQTVAPTRQYPLPKPSLLITLLLLVELCLNSFLFFLLASNLNCYFSIMIISLLLIFVLFFLFTDQFRFDQQIGKCVNSLSNSLFVLILLSTPPPPSSKELFFSPQKCPNINCIQKMNEHKKFLYTIENHEYFGNFTFRFIITTILSPFHLNYTNIQFVFPINSFKSIFH